MSIKRAKIQCNRVTIEAKQSYWTEFCKNEVSESKDMYKVWTKVKSRSISYQIQKNKKKNTRTQFQTSVII